MEAERRVSGLAQEIAKERHEVRLLQAEWAVRTEPKRLERLVDAHLRLEPVRADQIVTLTDLPLPDLLEPLYAQNQDGQKSRTAQSVRDTDQAVLATMGPPAPKKTPTPVPLPQSRTQVELKNTPGPIAIPVIPRKRPFKARKPKENR
jgi:hypothetical protein